jgi:hypothetical protein
VSKNSKKRSRKARQASPQVRFESTGRNLTSQAGLIPAIKFLDRLRFTEVFSSHVRHQRARNAQYSLADGVYLILLGLMGGAFSISKCVALWSDGVLRRVAGWIRVPEETTVGRLFKEV